MKCQSDKPYPTVKVEKQNLDYAKLLLENYAGVISEDTAVHLYFYQSLVINEAFKDFANIMLSISKVEMHHLKLLGETISLLGLKPVFGTISKKNYGNAWNSKFIDYTTDLKEMLEINIKNEELAIKNYKKRIMEINDNNIKDLLLRIIEDEKLHIEIFKYYYNKFGF